MEFWEVQRYIYGNRRAERSVLEAARLHGFWILNSLGAKINNVEDLIRYPWDKKGTEAEVSEEDVEAALDLIREANEGKPEA